MAEYLIKDTTLTEIADAVRVKTKKTDPILVSNIADEILGMSGDADLNFEIIGGTSAPSNPKENTIWVDTNIPIPGYLFSATDPNLLDFSNWANNVDVIRGTKTVSGNAITLKASENNCCTSRTNPEAFVPCVPGKTYVLEWEHSGEHGKVYIFPNGSESGLVSTIATNKRLEYIAAEGVTKFSFWFVVSTANSTATYSNVRITEKERSFTPGAVWIKTGASSNAAFNALKKNGIQVYPLSAKQYVSGAWVEKPAESWQDGAWVEWIRYLYNAGAEPSGSIKLLQGTNGTAGSPSSNAKKNASDIELYVYRGSSSGHHAWAYAYTEDKVDLAGCKEVCIDVSSVEGTNVLLYVTNTLPTGNWDDTDKFIAMTTITNTGICKLAIDGIESAYVGAGFRTTDGAGTKSLKFTKLWV